jgi:Rab-like protein 5
LEFEKKEKLGGETTLIDIELWDCGGDKDYETCWPVFRQDAKGLILVYDPSLTTDRTIDKWYKYFIKQNPSMNDTNCVLFALHKPTNHKKTSEWKAPTSLQSVRCTHVEMSSDNYGTINETFSDFIRELLVAMKMKQESDEVKIVGKKRK